MSEGLKPVASPKISIRSLQRKIRVNIGELQDFAIEAIRRCLQLNKHKRTDLSELRDVFVWLISDRRMAWLHRKFMHQSGPTDVLTFHHGEIFISVETAKRHARSFKTSLGHELRLYLVHGLLHLHEFDDRTPIGARKMARIQQKILQAAGMRCER